MIQLREIEKYYGELKAVSNLNVTFPKGQISVIIGPSGCGKTTTLKMINLMVKPTHGKITIDSKDINKFHPEKLRRSIGYVIQNIGLFPHMSVSNNISVVPRLLKWSKHKIRERTNELLELVGLDSKIYLEKYPNQLSGGEAQRIGVARALAADPSILLMDEPFGAVDPLTREILQTEFLEIQNRVKKTIVFITHDLDEAIKLADKLIIMKDGKIIQDDSPDRILTEPKNQFIRDFIGTDRALKRLLRLTSRDHMHDAHHVDENERVDEIVSKFAEHPFLWVTDSRGVLKGWINLRKADHKKSVSDEMTLIQPNTLSISPMNTLRDALSKMIGEGIRSIPIVDREHRLQGEVTLEGIQEVVNRQNQI